MTGYVYLVRMGRFHKIGMSHNPSKRLLAFSGLPYPVLLVHQIATEQPRLIERTLHRRFKDQRVVGEWFRLDEEQVAVILSVKKANAPDDLPPSLWPLSPLAGTPPNLVRLPTWAHEGMKEIARQNGRPLTWELKRLVAKYMKENGLPIPPEEDLPT